MTLWKWSQTGSADANADSTVNLLDNQAPSTLKFSARAIMAAVAKYRDDIGGSLVTGGTSTAYTVTTSQVLTSFTDGFTIKARMHATNGASPTLAVDSLTAKPIYAIGSGSPTAIPVGALAINQTYSFTYSTTAGGWLVVDRFGDLLSSSANADLVAIQALSSSPGVVRKTGAATYTLDDGTTNLIFGKDNAGNVLTTGVVGDLQVPFACTIKSNTLLIDQSGSLVVDIWRCTYSQFDGGSTHPVSGDKITASAAPTISSALKATDATLTGWTTSLAAGDILRFNINSVTSATRFSLMLTVKRFI